MRGGIGPGWLVLPCGCRPDARHRPGVPIPLWHVVSLVIACSILRISATARVVSPRLTATTRATAPAFLPQLSRFGSPRCDHDGSPDAEAAGHDCQCGRRTFGQAAPPLSLTVGAVGQCLHSSYQVGFHGWARAADTHRTVAHMGILQVCIRRIGREAVQLCWPSAPPLYDGRVIDVKGTTEVTIGRETLYV